MLRTLIWFDRGFRWTLGLACVLLFAVMILSVGGQVIMRYVFSSPLSWSEELARYSMVWMAMLASALAARLGQHIALMGALPLPGRLKIVVHTAATIITCAILGILFYHSYDLMMRAARQTTPGLGLSMSHVYASLPTGIGLMIVGQLLGVFMSWAGLGKLPEDVLAGEVSEMDEASAPHAGDAVITDPADLSGAASNKATGE
jgi:TRAP-type transport system small permease protein